MLFVQILNQFLFFEVNLLKKHVLFLSIWESYSESELWICLLILLIMMLLLFLNSCWISLDLDFSNSSNLCCSTSLSSWSSKALILPSMLVCYYCSFSPHISLFHIKTLVFHLSEFHNHGILSFFVSNLHTYHSLSSYNILLDETNCHSWIFRMESFLGGQNPFEFINGTNLVCHLIWIFDGSLILCWICEMHGRLRIKISWIRLDKHWVQLQWIVLLVVKDPLGWCVNWWWWKYCDNCA